MAHIKSTIVFPRSYRWSAYVTPKSSSVAQRAVFQWNKIQFQSSKVCYKVSLCENFQRQNYRAVNWLWSNRKI